MASKGPADELACGDEGSVLLRAAGRAAFPQRSRDLLRTLSTCPDASGRLAGNALVGRHSSLEKPGELARSLQLTARLCDLAAYLTDSCHEANKIASSFWLLT